MTNKVIAFYLPQFHQIPENDKWWGEGFTEWVNVKKAKKLYDNHNQPRIPFNDNYYDLSDEKVLKWQADIAKEHGVYGFCFYHYWFYQKPLLEKPLINLLNTSEIDIPFCFCWANESWTNAWAQDDNKVIMEQKYGNKEEWKLHFEFLLPFFKDRRYIKEDNQLLFVIYRPYLCDCMIEMLEYWKALAVENGFSGIKLASQRFEKPEKAQEIYDYFDYHIEYQPDYYQCHNGKKNNLISKIKSKAHSLVLKYLNKDISINKGKTGPTIFDYDEMWNKIIESNPSSHKIIAGGFVDWDNTPRHGRRGTCFKGVTVDKFEYYMRLQFKHIKEQYGNNYMFLFAWNEWGEGGYLEPDKKNGYGYLQALQRALNEEG